VLAISCVNIAGLMLARGVKRPSSIITPYDQKPRFGSCRLAYSLLPAAYSLLYSVVEQLLLFRCFEQVLLFSCRAAAFIQFVEQLLLFGGGAAPF
jgi:hypothetical protein